jgi:prepilin-type N-terminal cleavage/methylation domain-containing protein/prepilin-type processing-associated H-X9-DG protein
MRIKFLVMKIQNNKKVPGFTLVELLVVIAIIATLAVVGFSVAPKMLRKSKQAISVQNLRQVGSLAASYAVDSGGRLPAAQIERTNGDPPNWPRWQYWHHVLLTNGNPDLKISQLMQDSWWKKNEPVVLNPFHPKNSLWHARVGYALNLNIAKNLNPDPNAGHGWTTKNKRYRPPIAAINDTARTPLVSASPNWGFDGGFNNPNMEPYLVENKFDVVFVDGHVELMTPQQYDERNLYDQPTR